MSASPSAGAIVPTLRKAMRDRWAALLTDVTVTYGPANTSNTGDYLMIGADDPFRAEGEAATLSEDWSTATREGLDGSGEIVLVVFCWDGDTTAEAVEAVSDRAWAIVTAIGDDLDDTPALGAAGVWACNLTSVNESNQLGDYGASCLIAIRVHFESYRRRSS